MILDVREREFYLYIHDTLLCFPFYLLLHVCVTMYMRLGIHDRDYICGVLAGHMYTVGLWNIETTIFDPTSEFLNFLNLVYFLYCCFTKAVTWPNPDCSFYVPSTACRSSSNPLLMSWRVIFRVSGGGSSGRS